PTFTRTTGLCQSSPFTTQVWKTWVTQNVASEHGADAFRTKPRSTGAIGLGAGFTEYTATWLGPISAATKAAHAHRDGYVSTFRCGVVKNPFRKRIPGRNVGM